MSVRAYGMMYTRNEPPPIPPFPFFNYSRIMKMKRSCLLSLSLARFVKIECVDFYIPAMLSSISTKIVLDAST